MKVGRSFGKKLGAILKRAMRATSHTQKSLHQLTGLSQPTISRMLGGWTNADLASVLLLLHAVGKDLRWLCDQGLPMPVPVMQCVECGMLRSWSRRDCPACGSTDGRMRQFIPEFDIADGE